jgi:hypothetical protein
MSGGAGTSAEATPPEHVPFESAPPHRFESWLGLIRAGSPRVVRRAVLALVIGWVPLALLTLLHGDFMRPDHANAFIFDFGAHARFLITAPLLILAESLCAPRLAAIARHFVTGGLVAEAERPAYERAVDSTRRLLQSKAAEILTFVLAYALVASLLFGAADAEVPLWHASIAGGHLAATPAGWWGLLVSLPLLLLLLLGWLWRVGVWTRFLWLMSRMKLRLIPSHPDHAGGLKFVGYSLEAFVPLAFTFGVLGAGVVLNQVVNRGAPPTQFKYLAVGVAVFAVVLFAAPLLVFVRRLIEEHHRGMLAYGAFASRAGDEFERKWLMGPVDEQTLRSPDFAPTNSLYSIGGHAFAMSRLPFEPRSLAVLAGAALLPFVPVVVLSVPLDVLLRKVAGFFI